MVKKNMSASTIMSTNDDLLPGEAKERKFQGQQSKDKRSEHKLHPHTALAMSRNYYSGKRHLITNSLRSGPKVSRIF